MCEGLLLIHIHQLFVLNCHFDCLAQGGGGQTQVLRHMCLYVCVYALSWLLSVAC